MDIILDLPHGSAIGERAFRRSAPHEKQDQRKQKIADDIGVPHPLILIFVQNVFREGAGKAIFVVKDLLRGKTG